MAELNTNSSVVDYLKSSGKDASFGSRAQLAAQNGITNYTGSAEQNVALLGALKKGSTPTTPTQVTDVKSANAFINGSQEADKASASKGTDVPVRTSSQSYTDIFNNLKNTISGGMQQPAPAPNFESQYSSLRSANGITDLETSLNDLSTQEAEIRAGFRKQKTDEQGKPVAMNVIEGRVSEEERAANERLDAVLRQKDTITNQLKTKYDVVNNLMNFKKLDYQTATDEYNTKFTQNLNLFNTVKGIADDQKSDLDKEQDNARANAQIIYNSIKEGGLDLANLPADQKVNITKMEMQAGLPVGFYQTLQNKNPKADILTTTTRESNGAKYVDVIMKNADGSLSTKSMYVGATDKGGSGNPTQAETVKADAQSVASQLASRAGNDGYVAPEDYTKARKAWVNAGYDANDFDVRFAKTYVNPESYDSVRINSKALE